MTELRETIELMKSWDHKERFKAEYWQTLIRYEKLRDFCNKIEVLGNDGPEHVCSLEMLREQQRYMGLYLGMMEKRAILEKIDLGIIKSNDQ